MHNSKTGMKVALKCYHVKEKMEYTPSKWKDKGYVEWK